MSTCPAFAIILPFLGWDNLTIFFIELFILDYNNVCLRMNLCLFEESIANFEAQLDCLEASQVIIIKKTVNYKKKIQSFIDLWHIF